MSSAADKARAEAKRYAERVFVVTDWEKTQEGSVRRIIRGYIEDAFMEGWRMEKREITRARKKRCK